MSTLGGVKVARESFVARWLEPIDRLAEAIYGVLILMTFTMAAQATSGGEGLVRIFDTIEVRSTLLAAIGCTIAWGLIDGVMYVLTSIFERAEQMRLARLVQEAPTTEVALTLIAGELDKSLGPLTSPEERQGLYERVHARLRAVTIREVGVKREDLYGAVAIVIVATIATLPALIPFIFVPDNPWLALRLSNLIAILMLFCFGWRWARYVGTNPLLIGLGLASLGVAMVLVAIPLGG